MEEAVKKDKYRFSRLMYIFEAALEYFISILITGAYLAKITDAIGLSDSLTGILTAFVSLGCGFQIFALFLVNKKPVKKWVTFLHIVNQLCFSAIYLVPLVRFSKTLKTVVFIVLLLSGYIISNIINSPKINWFMSLVDDKKRGVFTANKEIVSLIGGMIFSYLMGTVIDRCEEAGRLNEAFIIGAITIFVLTLLHTLTLVLSKEKNEETDQKSSVKTEIKTLLKNKKVLKIILLAILWHMACYATTPFYGSYQIKELGFSMRFVSALSIIYAIIRSSFSRILGKYADKKSFISMLNICYIIALAGFAINIFTVPSNGKIVYTIYYILYAIALAGINSGTINLIYEEVEKSQRTGAYALQQSLSGIAGFITTTLVSLLVDKIQAEGNTFLGLTFYAQQVVSAIGAIVMIVIVIYLNTVMRKSRKENHV